MIDTRRYDKKLRNIYLGYLVRLLHKKYFVAMSPLAKKLGLNANYFRDFTKGDKRISEERLDLLEELLNDLYGSLLVDEVPQNRIEFNDFINTLSESLIYKEIIR
ncbi:MAG: hypothetical protein ABF991_00830 [Liquorilactobacillus hordei]|uniref:hypothetical protein n=1 Tax=Liquorilactobacillus hordei TaxID=468911 RepID=UPI0039ED728D